jgi:hypothetical protein
LSGSPTAILRHKTSLPLPVTAVVLQVFDNDHTGRKEGKFVTIHLPRLTTGTPLLNKEKFRLSRLTATRDWNAMKTGQATFNAVGILVAGFLLVSGIFSLTDSIRHDFPQRSPDFWFLFFVLDNVLVFLIGGGCLANLANRKFTLGPTLAVILGYCFTVILSPLAIWGLILLVQERKQHQKRRSHFD